MRRWSLALLITLASPALAQAPEPSPAAPAAPAPEPQKAPPAPAAEEKPAPAEPAPAKKPPAPAPTEAKAAPAPAAPAPAAKPPPTPSMPLPGASEEDTDAARRDRAKSAARFILENLLNGDARRVASELLYPFQLEDKKYATPDELVAAWVKQLRVKRTDLITLYDIEILTLPEMEKKYGKPPARLGLGNLRDQDLYVAVGNLSGHAAILLLRVPENAQARAFAYTD